MSTSAGGKRPSPRPKVPSCASSPSTPSPGRSIARCPRSRRPTAGGITSISTSVTTRPPAPGLGVSRGLSDGITARHYLFVDALDGRAHYVDIGRGEATEPTPEGAIVRIEPKHAEPRQVDRTVSEIAAANGGRYNVDIHLRHDPSASARFAETHVRRLEAIRRVTGGVEREIGRAHV